MKCVKISFFIFLCSTSCKKPSDFKNLCDPPFVFNNESRTSITFNIIATNIFNPYCSPCHSTETYLSNLQKRDGYLPLDSDIKLRLSGDLTFYNVFQKYIDFKQPSQSKLIKVLKDGGVPRTPYSGSVTYKEPRFQCEIPEDIIQGITWWIENANGEIEHLLN